MYHAYIFQINYAKLTDITLDHISCMGGMQFKAAGVTINDINVEISCIWIILWRKCSFDFKNI